MTPWLLEGYDAFAELQKWRNVGNPQERRSWHIHGGSFDKYIEVTLAWVYKDERLSVRMMYRTLEESTFAALLQYGRHDWET